MGELNLQNATVLERGITDYSTSSQALDYTENIDEVFVDFPNAAKYFGYYKKYGQLKKAIDTLCIYIVGKGFSADTPKQMETLDNLRGFGEDTAHSLFWNMQATAFIQGDAFAEIVRDEDNRIVNLKPFSPERARIVYGRNGLVKRYEHKTLTGWKKLNPSDVFHISTDRIADEQRGVSFVESCEWVIDAIEEARTDYRKLLHRNIVPVRIIEVDTDDVTKRNALMNEYKSAIQKGEVLVVPKGVVEFKEDTIQVTDPIAWIQSLENYFYLAVGIPRVIASPDQVSEGSSKVSYLVFEPIYTYRQLLLEKDIYNQLGIKITFNRPASLQDNIQSNEAKNTSQTGFQPKDMTVTGGRE